MKKSKIFLTLTLSGVAAIGAAVATSYAKKSSVITAETCTHSYVEHYESFSDTVSGAGYVEHWACCECHTAWADENKTINNLNEKQKSDMQLITKKIEEAEKNQKKKDEEYFINLYSLIKLHKKIRY